MKLIDKYLPSDYNDSVSKRIKLAEPLTPDAIFEGMFCNFPKPVDWLFKLRNVIVKPFGLQGGGGFVKLISERNDEEIILSKNDKHLCFWVGIFCSLSEDEWQEATVTTVVKFNNFLGRIYFIGIWIFHKILVKSLFRRTLIRAQQTCNRNKYMENIREYSIRLEEPVDWQEVENLTREAFWNVYRPGCVEHFVLNRYRSNSDFIPELDFVMEVGGRIIGHVIYSRAELTSDEGDVLQAWTLGPISIHPEWKRKGYGLELLKFSLEKARKMGIGVLCFEGNIGFYGNAGFVLASSLGIHYHAEPKDDPVPYFLAQELAPGYLCDREWTYCPPKGYFAADDDPEGFEKYEAAFPAKEKHFLEGQLPQFCQSCGIPMASDDLCGTDADGSPNFDYCKYCYKDGEFIDKVSMEEYIEMCSQFGAQAGMTNEQMREHCRMLFPMLKRWRRE